MNDAIARDEKTDEVAQAYSEMGGVQLLVLARLRELYQEASYAYLDLRQNDVQSIGGHLMVLIITTLSKVGSTVLDSSIYERI